MTPPSSASTEQLLVGARVVTPHDVVSDGWVHVADGRIRQVGRDARPHGIPQVDLDGAWLLPGFIDLHMHGGGGHDVATSPDDMAGAVAFHHRHGTTRTLVSLVTAPVEDLERQLRWVATLTERGPGSAGHVVGAHLEGPFLSHARCGAQNADYLMLPNPAALERMRAAARGTLRVVTVAPELDGAIPLIEDIVAGGSVAALGHSDATYDQAVAGVRAGATLATHLFNGMRPMHHREPALIGAALEHGLTCELINDGVHVHPAITGLVAADPDRMALITDAIDATGVGDGEYVLGGQRVRVAGGHARLASTGSLAGSTLTLDESLRRAVTDSGLDIVTASRAASANPARTLGIHQEVGAIAPGLAADLVALTDDLTVSRVMADGRWCEATAENHVVP